ncbi:MAG: NAD(+)--rifampin ADP-ribosyltransferase [Tabrizicola sp.]
MTQAPTVFAQSFFHRTKAELDLGDLIEIGHPSNFQDTGPLSWVYFSATLDAAIWGAELAASSGPDRIYVIEPTGPFEDDPNLTDKRFVGNPTMSYRSRQPLRVLARVADWHGHATDTVRHMKDSLARMSAAGDMPIED